MSIPEALVEIRLLRVEGLSPKQPDRLGFSKQAYVNAYIGDVFFGRSLAPDENGVFDFSKERIPWSAVVRVLPGAPLTLITWVHDEMVEESFQWFLDTVPRPYAVGQHEFQEFDGGSAKLIFEVVKVRELPAAERFGVITPGVDGAPVQSTVAVVPKLLVEITDVEGLYAPLDPLDLGPGKAGAVATAGYISTDNKGRIFLNRDRKGAWKKDHQSIRLSVKVTSAEPWIPKDAKVRWTLEVPNDPTNDWPDYHVEWGAYLEPSDWDTSKTPFAYKGAGPGVNRGAPDHTPIFESTTEATATPTGPSACTTTLKLDALRMSGTSSLIVHCPSLPGDRILLRATVESATTIEVYEDATGVMTMWNRFDVAHLRMPSASAIDVAAIPVHFLKLCSQLDFMEKEIEIDDEATIGATNDDLLARAKKWRAKVKPASDPADGWIFLVAALSEVKLVDGTAPFFVGPVTFTALLDADSARLPFPLPAPAGSTAAPSSTPPSSASALVTYTSGGSTVRSHVFEAEFSALEAGGTVLPVRLAAQPRTYHPVFNIGGNKGMKLGPPLQMQLMMRQFGPPVSGSWFHAGYLGTPTGSTQTVTLSLQDTATARGALGITAMSTKGVVLPLCVVFTTPLAGGAFGELAAVATHELGHAIGLSHQCGYFDYRTNRTGKGPLARSCAMSYFEQELMTADVSVQFKIDKVTTKDEADPINLELRQQPGSSGPHGFDHCGRHIALGRRIHNEDLHAPAGQWWK